MQALLGVKFLSYFMAFISLIFERKLYRMHLKINGEHIRGRIMTVCIGSAWGYGQHPVQYLTMAGWMYRLSTAPNCCNSFGNMDVDGRTDSKP